MPQGSLRPSHPLTQKSPEQAGDADSGFTVKTLAPSDTGERTKNQIQFRCSQIRDCLNKLCCIHLKEHYVAIKSCFQAYLMTWGIPCTTRLENESRTQNRLYRSFKVWEDKRRRAVPGRRDRAAGRGRGDSTLSVLLLRMHRAAFHREVTADSPHPPFGLILPRG